jgi:hypothetical protein
MSGSGACKNPHLRHLVSALGWNHGMFGLSVADDKVRVIVLAMAGLLVLAALGLFLSFSPQGSALGAARDYEECVQAAPSTLNLPRAHLPPNNAGGVAVADCSARFAGRRKVGGGYTYYDFMQDRSFDIAGPNPTPEERNWIDREYIGYLDVQRQDHVSAESAKRQEDELRADLERAGQPAGPPLVLTPKNRPAQALKRPSDRLKPASCADNSLACSWSKLSAAVKDAFASSPLRQP